LGLFALHSLCGVVIVRMIGADRKDVNVASLSLLSAYAKDMLLYVICYVLCVFTLARYTTPDDGRILPKHVVRKNGDWIKSCI
jgi:hypothetical protein